MRGDLDEFKNPEEAFLLRDLSGGAFGLLDGDSFGERPDVFLRNRTPFDVAMPDSANAFRANSQFHARQRSGSALFFGKSTLRRGKGGPNRFTFQIRYPNAHNADLQAVGLRPGSVRVAS